MGTMRVLRLYLVAGSANSAWHADNLIRFASGMKLGLAAVPVPAAAVVADRPKFERSAQRSPGAGPPFGHHANDEL